MWRPALGLAAAAALLWGASLADDALERAGVVGSSRLASAREGLGPSGSPLRKMGDFMFGGAAHSARRALRSAGGYLFAEK